MSRKRTTQDLADRETARLIRSRVLIPAGIVGFIAASAVAIPVSVFVPKAAQSKDCHAISALAGLGQKRLDQEQKETKDFEAKSHDRFGLTQGDFEALLRKKHQEETERQTVLNELQARSC